MTNKDQTKNIYKIAIVFAVFTLLYFFLNLRVTDNVSDELSKIGFQKDGSNHFIRKMANVTINLVYHKRRDRSDAGKAKFEIIIQSNKVNLELSDIFCTSKELNNFVSKNIQNWYPTTEEKLANGHYVGKCYPTKMTNAIAKLPKSSHGFKSRITRYLYIPKLINRNVQELAVYTDNTDTTTIHARLENFLKYYELVLQQ